MCALQASADGDAKTGTTSSPQHDLQQLCVQLARQENRLYWVLFWGTYLW
jgi:hypothetical protein